MTRAQHILDQIETQSTLHAQAITTGRMRDECDRLHDENRKLHARIGKMMNGTAFPTIHSPTRFFDGKLA